MEKYKIENNEQKVVVSDLFIDIYKNFNVSNQVNRMKQLSKKELYLLLICSTDKHNYLDPVVRQNLLGFREKLKEIMKIGTDDEEIKNESLLELMKETGSKYITIDNIVDRKGNKLFTH